MKVVAATMISMASAQILNGFAGDYNGGLVGGVGGITGGGIIGGGVVDAGSIGGHAGFVDAGYTGGVSYAGAAAGGAACAPGFYPDIARTGGQYTTCIPAGTTHYHTDANPSAGVVAAPAGFGAPTASFSAPPAGFGVHLAGFGTAGPRAGFQHSDNQIDAIIEGAKSQIMRSIKVKEIIAQAAEVISTQQNHVESVVRNQLGQRLTSVDKEIEELKGKRAQYINQAEALNKKLRAQKQDALEEVVGLAIKMKLKGLEDEQIKKATNEVLMKGGMVKGLPVAAQISDNKFQEIHDFIGSLEQQFGAD